MNTTKEILNAIEVITNHALNTKQATMNTAKKILNAIQFLADESESEIILLGSRKTRAKLAPAIIGVVYADIPKVVYSYTKLIYCLMDTNSWNEYEAMDWYDDNIAGSLTGAEDEPLVMHDLP